MGIVNLPLIFLITFYLGLGFFVLFNNKKLLINQSFAAFLFSTTAWIFSNFLIDNLESSTALIFWNRLAFALGILVALSFVYFTFAFRESKKVPVKLSFLLKTGLIPLLTICLSFTNFLVADAFRSNNVVNVKMGSAELPYYLIFLSLLVLAFYNIFKTYQEGTFLKKLQLRYFILGTLTTIVLIIVTNILIPIISNNWSQAAYTPYFTVIMFVSISYAILRHRLLDIEVIIRRSLIYSILLAALTGIYSILVFGLNRIFLPEGTAAFPRITDIIAIVLVALTVDPLKRFIEKATDKVFFKARYNAEETINSVSETLASVIDLPQLVREIKKVLTDTVKISKIAIYAKSDHHYEPLEGANDFKKSLDITVEKKHFIKDYFEKHPELVVVSEIKQNIQDNKKVDPSLAETVKSLSEHNVEIIAPLLVKGELTGAMFLGEKLSQDIYSNEDIRFIEILSHQAALALENAKLYQEEKLYGIHLKQEVEKATESLRSANERLKELDEAKDEFVSVASHELRTPMTAIKSYVWLTLNNRAGEINVKTRDYLNKVYVSSERMIALIGDMLNVSRIETGRIQMDIRVVSPYKVIDMVLSDLLAKAGELGVALTAEKENIVPLVKTDRNKLAEILMNLAGNSLKFTPKGGKVTISAKKVDDMVTISVADNGVGISKENIPALFAKFGRIESSYAAAGQNASTGTGLGLWISKNYIEKMGGKIWVNSELGKGTTFTFSLPIATGAKEETPVNEDDKFVPRKVIT
jgi:signal transduction histidine kinase